ncbi:MAG: SRPBCC family protein [Bacteroidetes bacterium]|nr:SRPBCC family protein [Bacteroidota bacterium]
MKFLKKLFYGILVLIALFLIAAFFVDGKYSVEKKIVVNRPSAEVYDYLKNLKNQAEYSVWQKIDPQMKKSYIGKDGTVGFVSAWESNNDKVGKGEQELTKLIEGQRIEMELRFFEPFEANDKAYFTTKKQGLNSTEVSWGFKGEMSYPTNLFLLVMDMEELIGKDLEEGLVNLKSQLEK